MTQNHWASLFEYTFTATLPNPEILSIRNAKKGNRLLKEFCFLNHLQEGPAERCLSDSKLAKWDEYHSAEELNNWYRELFTEEMHVCQEIAIQSLLGLNDFIFNGEMPSELRLEAEAEGITDIFQIFSRCPPSINGRLKHDLLLRLPQHLRKVSRIMDFALRKLSTQDFKYRLEEDFELYHPKICKRVAKEMVMDKFEMYEALTDEVIKFIDSDPKHRGVPIFCDADEEDQTNIGSIRRKIELCEDRIRATTTRIADALIRKWESDDIEVALGDIDVYSNN